MIKYINDKIYMTCDNCGKEVVKELIPNECLPFPNNWAHMYISLQDKNNEFKQYVSDLCPDCYNIKDIEGIIKINKFAFKEDNDGNN